MITMMGRRKMESLFQWSNMGMHGEFVKLINNDGSVCGLSSELTQKAACIIFRARCQRYCFEFKENSDEFTSNMKC